MKLQGCLSSLEKLGKAYFFILGWNSWKNILLMKILVGKAGKSFSEVYIFLYSLVN